MKLSWADSCQGKFEHTQILEDLKIHIGDDRKFVSVADAIRTAYKKIPNQLDVIDKDMVEWGYDLQEEAWMLLAYC